MTAAAVFFLLSPFEATATSVSTSAQRLLSDSDTGLVSFPLVPHHVQRRRLGLDVANDNQEEEENNNNNNNDSSLRNRRRRSRKTLGGNDHLSHSTMGGLYMGYGTHYVDLYCGSPNPQRQTVIVDTGSSKTAFPCQECQDCGQEKYHADALFDESLSETFQKFDCDNCSKRSTCNEENDRCEIEQSYSEGSYWNAYEAMETCYLGGYHNQAILTVSRSSEF